MARHKSLTLGVVAATTLLFGCDPTGDIGVAPLTPVGTFFTDTLTVRTSTVLADSVRTTSPDIYLAGRYVDPIFGTITATSFVRMALAQQLDFGANPLLDSLTLNTQYGYTYGDTLPAQTIAVHRLREVIDPVKNYYNNSSVAYDPTPLAQRTFLPRPGSNGSLRFRLPDALGQELIAVSGKDAGKKNDDFAKVLAGLALVGGANNTAVLGFPAINNAMTLNLYYHTATDSTRKVFPIYAVAVNQQSGAPILRAGFNRVTADRKGTALAGLTPTNPLPPGGENEITYVQDALGIRTKIEIPYLKSLAKNGPIAINRAELSIKPVLSANGPNISPPPYLLLFKTNATNRLLYDAAGSTSFVLNDVSTNPTPDPPAVPYVARTQNYSWRIATQLNSMLLDDKTSNAFLVGPVYTQSLGQNGSSRFQSQFNNIVSRLVLSAKKEDVKLIVFYTQARE